MLAEPDKYAQGLPFSPHSHPPVIEIPEYQQLLWEREHVLLGMEITPGINCWNAYYYWPFTSYVHEPNFRVHFCRSNGKYCTSIGQVLVKEAGQNQLHLPELDKITGVLYLSVPPLNSLSALQVALKTLEKMVCFLDGKKISRASR